MKVFEWIAKMFGFFKSVYSEPDGNGSSTRVHIGILTAFVISVGISFSILVHQKIVSIEQFDNFLSSAATFLIGTCGPLYGINKLADAYKSKNSDSNQGQ